MSIPIYVSCVAGKLVARLPLSARRREPTYFGAERGGGRAWDFDPSCVVMITTEELEVHGRTYARAIRDGDLVQRTEAEYLAQQSASKHEPTSLNTTGV